MSYQVKEIFYTLQGEGANALPAATCGPAASRIALLPSAAFATPILSAPTAREAASLPTPTRWHARSPRSGRPATARIRTALL
jgi:hypothetical protein